MEKEIKNILRELVGFEFTRTRRTGATECLHFGTKLRMSHKGVQQLIGEFGIHLQCPWRITKGNILLVGSDDLTEQPDEKLEYDEDFNWDIQGGNLRDVKMEAFLNSGKYIVESVNADEFGGFEMNFNDNVKLTVFPALSSKSEYNECWRLLDNRDEHKSHFVVNATGYISMV